MTQVAQVLFPATGLVKGDPPIFEKQTILTIAEALHIGSNSF